MQRIILFYLFTPISDPMAIKLWQQTLAVSLNLRGRLIIAEHGINGTLGGEMSDLKKYIKDTKTYPGFKKIVFKWSNGSREDFPRLSVKVRPELVTFGVAEKLRVDDNGIVGGGKKLTPVQLHKLVKEKGNEVVFVDGRNSREAAIGRFKNAIVMDVNHTRDFPREITKAKYSKLKQKSVITYCTGGIRCEVLSKLLKDEGYEDVYQLDGGIVKYIEKYGDSGLWEGSLFVFDNRMNINASDETKLIGECVHCKNKTSNYANCSNKSCNELILSCNQCVNKISACVNCATTEVAGTK